MKYNEKSDRLGDKPGQPALFDYKISHSRVNNQGMYLKRNNMDIDKNAVVSIY